MESILLEDNPHWVNEDVYNSFIPREILKKALSFISTREIIAIIGARRVGKSTLAKLMIKELLSSINAKNIFFINLEKPSFIPYKSNPEYLNKIFDEYLKLANPNTNKTIYFFIDEIQIFSNWEVFIKSKYENSNIKFIITGSNSSLLSSSYATLLTGRVLKLKLYSFNFKEFLEYKKIDISTKIQVVKNKIKLKRAVDEYLKWGGYHSVISTNDELLKKELLKNIAEDIILKDIVPRYKIKNSEAIKDLFYYVVSNARALLNYSSLAKKLNLDSKMVKEYIGYFEDNFLISKISLHHNKLTSQIKSAKKLYINDNGFLNLGVNQSKNLGIYFENLLFIALCQKYDNLTYIRETFEIDFYTKDALYQVSYDISDEKTKARELNAFNYFKSKKELKKYLITYDASEKINDIEIVDIVSFLLTS